MLIMKQWWAWYEIKIWCPMCGCDCWWWPDWLVAGRHLHTSQCTSCSSPVPVWSHLTTNQHYSAYLLQMLYLVLGEAYIDVSLTSSSPLYHAKCCDWDWVFSSCYRVGERSPTTMTTWRRNLSTSEEFQSREWRGDLTRIIRALVTRCTLYLHNNITYYSILLLIWTQVQRIVPWGRRYQVRSGSWLPTVPTFSYYKFGWAKKILLLVNLKIFF